MKVDDLVGGDRPHALELATFVIAQFGGGLAEHRRIPLLFLDQLLADALAPRAAIADVDEAGAEQTQVISPLKDVASTDPVSAVALDNGTARNRRLPPATQLTTRPSSAARRPTASIITHLAHLARPVPSNSLQSSRKQRTGGDPERLAEALDARAVRWYPGSVAAHRSPLRTAPLAAPN